MAERSDPGAKREVQRAYIGLGSNEGDRVGFVQQAMQFLKDDPAIEVVECSSLYETEPVGGVNVNWFVNAVAAIETDMSADELLAVCQKIEDRLSCLYGASPGLQGSKTRIIDLDILFYGEEIIASRNLTVPHPDLHKRAYALVPLLEVSPDLIHPQFAKTVSELHEELPEPELVYLYGTRGEQF